MFCVEHLLYRVHHWPSVKNFNATSRLVEILNVIKDQRSKSFAIHPDEFFHKCILAGLSSTASGLSYTCRQPDRPVRMDHKSKCVQKVGRNEMNNFGFSWLRPEP